jgi:hypothetical protein
MRQKIVDPFDQLTNRMTLGSVSKILGGEMYIYLRAGDQPVSQQISYGHQSDAGLDQMRGKSMPQLMRRNALLDPGFATSCPHSFVDRVPRHNSTFTTAEERVLQLHRTTGNAILPEHMHHVFIERHCSLVSAFANDMDRFLLPVYILLGEAGTFTGPYASAI